MSGKESVYILYFAFSFSVHVSCGTSRCIIQQLCHTNSLILSLQAALLNQKPPKMQPSTRNYLNAMYSCLLLLNLTALSAKYLQILFPNLFVALLRLHQIDGNLVFSSRKFSVAIKPFNAYCIFDTFIKQKADAKRELSLKSAFIYCEFFIVSVIMLHHFAGNDKSTVNKRDLIN